MDWSLPRSVYNVALMTEVAATHGLSAGDCLKNSGIDLSDLNEPDTEITIRQELAVVANIVQHLGHIPSLGIEMGQRIHMAVYGILAFAMCSAASIREVLTLAERYSHMTFTLVQKSFRLKDGEVQLIIDGQHLPESLRRFVIERDVVGISNVQRELFLTQLPGIRAEFNFPRPEYADRYQAQLGAMPKFDAPFTVLAFSMTILDQPLPQANPHVKRQCEAQLNALLARRKERAGISGRVRAILLRRPDQAPDMEAIGTELNTTSRNLRRMLLAEGTSFRALVDEVRVTLAEELLSGARLTVEEVADRLGYNEVASFSNAFKRWKGMPPREWRNANMQRIVTPQQPLEAA